MVFVMVGVPFLTSLERNVLGYILLRKGLNRVGFVGILHPLEMLINYFLVNNIFL